MRFGFSGRIAAGIAVLMILGWASAASAHRINVFAYAEGDIITVQGGYSKSRPVKGGTVIVADKADGDEFLRGETDDLGFFVFNVPESAKAERADLRITLIAGEGHQDSWIVEAKEYAPAAADADDTSTSTMQPYSEEPAGQSVSAAGISMDEAAMRRIVEEVVERKIAPVREMLLEEQQSGPGLAEVMGGLGYFVGLFGIAAYLKSRKS